MDSALATAMHAMRSSVATTLGGASGALVFGGDMLLNIPLMADWHLIARNHEQLLNESLCCQNLSRRKQDYVMGQKVLMMIHDPMNLGERTEGPYTITTVHVNGTVSIELSPGIIERINIRRIFPYRG
ncbi:hypothetical protein ACHAWX_006219 [Stephanocyclus meneghinianus]